MCVSISRVTRCNLTATHDLTCQKIRGKVKGVAAVACGPYSYPQAMSSAHWIRIFYISTILIGASCFSPGASIWKNHVLPRTRTRPSFICMSSNEGSKKVPDAITQTDNSAKRQQNAQMRATSAAMYSDEPEALRKMREEREARESREQEQALLDAQRRAKNNDFVSGQDLREAR
jgi:hypothetical protein